MQVLIQFHARIKSIIARFNSIDTRIKSFDESNNWIDARIKSFYESNNWFKAHIINSISPLFNWRSANHLHLALN
jgi:hypothetical protein